MPEGVPFPQLSPGDVLIYGAVMAQMASATSPAGDSGEGAGCAEARAQGRTAATRMGKARAGRGLLADAAGHTYTYNAQHRIATADNNNIQYVYNAFGQRVEKSVGGVAWYYLYGPAGRVVVELSSNGGGYRSEIFADGRHIATYVNNATYFDYSDWLGTERLTATLSGYEQDACTSLPYGDDFACSGPGGDPTPLHFRGISAGNSA